MDREERYAAEAVDQVKLALRSLDQAKWRFRFCEDWRAAERCDALATLLWAAFPGAMPDLPDDD